MRDRDTQFPTDFTKQFLQEYWKCPLCTENIIKFLFCFICLFIYLFAEHSYHIILCIHKTVICKTHEKLFGKWNESKIFLSLINYVIRTFRKNIYIFLSLKHGTDILYLTLVIREYCTLKNSCQAHHFANLNEQTSYISPSLHLQS